VTRTEFTDLVTACGNPDRGTALAAQDALIDWWRDEGEQNAEDARKLEDAEERAEEIDRDLERVRGELDDLRDSICSVCLHDIRHDPICRSCVEASADRHVASYPRLTARA